MNKRYNIADLSAMKHSENNSGIRFVDDGIMLIDNFTQLPENVNAFQFDMIVLVLCRSGRLQVNINGKVFMVEKDSLLLCTNLFTLTEAMLSTDFSSTIMAFSLKRIESIFPSYGQNLKSFLFLNENPVLKLLPEELPIVQHYRDLLEDKLSMPHHRLFANSLNCIIQAAMFDLLGVINRIMEHQPSGDEHAASGNSITNSLVQKFIMLLSDDMSHNRTVKYFADKLCITPKYLSTLCRQETGKVPSAWIREMLVDRIRIMLVSTSLSCKEISAQLEFPNSSFFGKFTKQHLGCSPQEYRRRHQ